MNILFYAAVAIVTVNLFAAVVYHYFHRGVGLAISLVGTILICVGLTYATLNDVPASTPTPTIHPSLDPSAVSRETPSPAATPSKRPAYTKVQPRHAEKAPIVRTHFDDMEKQLSHTGKGTDPGAGGCDDAAAGGCK